MLATLLISILTMLMAVAVHYEALRFFGQRFPRAAHYHRYGIAFLLVGAIVAHVIEIWLFAVAYWCLVKIPGTGEIVGATAFLDFVYFSFINFTTIGYGDVVPKGYVRFLAGTEGLTGFVLITWTASFLYVQMGRLWRD
ncbi:MAG: ion channel [Pseudomonadota bacterium]